MAFSNKLREQLTQSFVEALNQDRIPWQACWQTPTPENGVTGRKYQNTNAIYLSHMASVHKYMDNRWCTFNQIKEKGWHLQKGAKGHPIEYWAYYDKEQKKMLSWTDARRIYREDPDYAKENFLLRSKTFIVFNAQQIDGIPERTAQKGTNINEIRQQRDTLLQNMGVRLLEGFSDPSYSPVADVIYLPREKDFHDVYSYACTFLHEAGHATGHPSRLNRDMSGGFGSESYAKEELRAEIASAFTAQALGLHLTNRQLEHHMNLHKSYIQSWAAVIQNNPEELFRAIKDAEKISDYLIEKGEFPIEKEQAMEQKQESKAPEKAVNTTDLDKIVTGTTQPQTKPLTLDERIAQAKEKADAFNCQQAQKAGLQKTADKDFAMDL